MYILSTFKQLHRGLPGCDTVYVTSISEVHTASIFTVSKHRRPLYEFSSLWKPRVSYEQWLCRRLFRRSISDDVL